MSFIKQDGFFMSFLCITVTNVRMFCEDTDPHGGTGNHTLTGDGTTEGVYTAAQYCPKDSYVCGINSQMEPYQHDGDDTALNHVKFHCCKVTLIGW